MTSYVPPPLPPDSSVAQVPPFLAPPEFPNGGATVYAVPRDDNPPPSPSVSSADEWFRRYPTGGTIYARAASDGGETGTAGDPSKK